MGTADGDTTGARYLVLANRGAGDDDAELIERGAAVLRERHEVELRWTSSAEEVVAIVAAAPPETTFVGAGGDGTIQGLVGALRGEGRLDRPVGLLPVGTGNDLARNVGLPVDPVAAARAILSGGTRRLPLVEHDGRVIVNCAHTGLGIAAAARADALKDRLGALAYPAGTLRAIIGYGGMEIALRLDGEHLFRGPCTAVAVVVAGVGVGGGHPVMPAGYFPRASDAFAVVVANAPRLAGRLMMPLHVARNRRPPGMSITHGAELEWRHDGPLPIDVDGQLDTWAPDGTLGVTGSWEILGADQPG